MGDMSAGLGCSNRRAARVGKKIEDFHFSAGRYSLLNNSAEPVPVDSLFREQSGVLEIKGLEPEGEVPVVDRPLLRKVEELPLAAALAAAVVVRVGVSPFPPPGGLPYYLRVGTDELIAAPDLQLLAVGRVQYLIVFPGICNPHSCLHSFLKYNPPFFQCGSQQRYTEKAENATRMVPIAIKAGLKYKVLSFI